MSAGTALLDRSPAGEGSQRFLDMLSMAERALETELPIVNGLNVFPVPDGDTGTNMLATLREAIGQAQGAASLEAAAQAAASGALLGARGNSGVILSQVLRAGSEAVAAQPGLTELGPREVADILQRASALAYKAVSNPVEGTMLSVLKAAAVPALNDELPVLLGKIVEAAEAALAHTPEQLRILAEAQVVDSGGYGLLLVLRAWYEALLGYPPRTIGRSLLGVERVRRDVDGGGANPAALIKSAPASSYGYCVTALVDAPGADEGSVREELGRLGDSLLIVAVGRQLKLHVHVPDPEVALQYARSLGTIVRTEISNIDEQIAAQPAVALPVMAVAPGEGLARVFRGLGATTIAGGPTQNPSAGELLSAAEQARTANPGVSTVFVLPNNGNILAAARQAAATTTGVLVVPTRSVPQGVAALLSYDSESSAEDNLERMTAAAAAVVSAELMPAARDATIGGTTVRTGELMGMLDGDLVGAGEGALSAIVSHPKVHGAELATIYYGLSVDGEGAEVLKASILALRSELDVEIVRGDQPHAHYILSFE